MSRGSYGKTPLVVGADKHANTGETWCSEVGADKHANTGETWCSEVGAYKHANTGETCGVVKWVHINTLTQEKHVV